MSKMPPHLKNNQCISFIIADLGFTLLISFSRVVYYRLGILCFTTSIHLSPGKIGSMGVEREGRVEGKKEGRRAGGRRT